MSSLSVVPSSLQSLSLNETQQTLISQVQQSGITSSERFHLFKQFGNTFPAPSTLVAFYDAWAKNFDLDMRSISYNIPDIISGEINILFPFQRDIRILDVASGTGLVGEKLQSLGFTNIDAVDASQQMLNIAQSKKVYKNLFYELFTPEEGLLESYSNAEYDLIVSAGAFAPNHLTGKHFDFLLKLLKPGGILIISESPQNDLYVNLKPVIEQHELSGTIETLQEQFVTNCLPSVDGTIWVFEKNV